MSTSAPLAYPAARKPAFKRRRLLDPSRALTDNSNVAPTPNAPSLPQLCAKLSCSTCHRALSTAIRRGVVTCSRCTAPTCAICARTCTSYSRPSSFPPTPALTRSPSPTATTSVSPKRTFNHAAVNCHTSLTTTKRKKPPIDKDDDDSDGDASDLDDSVVRDLHDTLSTHGFGRDAAESVIVHGCGRIVCRACCVESVPNDGKLCVDCFALV